MTPRPPWLGLISLFTSLAVISFVRLNETPSARFFDARPPLTSKSPYEKEYYVASGSPLASSNTIIVAAALSEKVLANRPVASNFKVLFISGTPV
jgi:hypothetical protein